MKKSPVRSDAAPTRGAGKLAAAVARFGMDARWRGRAAIDVGAGTGGFTRVLLAAGVQHVTAVDVGHGQLAADLRADPRVTTLEKTDFKRASLHVAPGPFSAFSVDVSFVAARNMLRGLAFRLAPGAEGVVLLKPQFELPSHLVVHGEVSDPALRARALALLSGKAESLGFVVRDVVDSPVPGGSGTVEMLVHLAFTGRPAHLPALGERRPARPAKPGRSGAVNVSAQAARPWRWFAVAAPGLADVIAAEVQQLPGARELQVDRAGVEFTGELAVGAAANRRLRIATRVLLRVGEVRAREFAPLRHQLARLPWELFAAPGAVVAVNASTTRCRLYHTGALAEQLRLAMGDRLRAPVREPTREVPADEGETPESPEEPAVRVFLRGEGDVFVVSVDSSGALLHQRGWRAEAGPAPLRETLAAGVLALCGWAPGEALLDPMCGAGTLVIEAAARVVGAPERRAHAFERWPLWQAAAEMPSETVTVAELAPLVGCDRDPAAIEIARRNAERAGVASAVTFTVASLEQVEPPAERGLLVVNPPYGRRLPDARAALASLETALRGPFRQWRAGVLVPGRGEAAGRLKLRPERTHALVNGGLPVTLLVLPAGAPPVRSSRRPRRRG